VPGANSMKSANLDLLINELVPILLLGWHVEEGRWCQESVKNKSEVCLGQIQ